MSSSKQKQIWLFLLKGIKYVLAIAVFFVAYYQLKTLWDKDGYAVLSEAVHGRWMFLLFSVLLMPLNWGIEIVKWYLLSSRISRENLVRKAFQVLTGISFSVVTPNRLGEYMGRVLHFEPKHQVGILGMNIIGNLAQLSVIVTMGLLCFLLTLDSLSLGLPSSWNQHQLVALAVGVFSLLFLSYIFIGKILRWFLLKFHFNSLAKVKSKLKVISKVSPSFLLKIWFISWVRYVIYALQFLMLIFFMGIELTWWQGLSAISIIFLIQTGVPLPAFLSLVIRSEVAVFILSKYKAADDAVLLASYLLWVINLGIPALIGLWPTLLINVRKTIGYENE